jgi:hypothetical protein
MDRREANRIALAQCNKDVAEAQRARVKDLGFWLDLLILAVVIVGTLVSLSESSSMAKYEVDSSITAMNETDIYLVKDKDGTFG